MSRRYTFERTTRLEAPAEEVFEFFSNPANLGRITPQAMRFRITSSPERPLREGDRISYSIRVFGLPMRWTTRIVMWRPFEKFADIQERGPYRYWFHTHIFTRDGTAVVMKDVVEYELPLGLLGRIVGSRAVARQLEAIFSFRAHAIAQIFSAR